MRWVDDPVAKGMWWLNGMAGTGKSTIRAFPLFISADTACRFVAEPKIDDPNARLQKVLKYRNKANTSALDKTYLPVLAQQIDDLSSDDEGEVIEKFRYVIGTIVLLSRPLSVVALSAILDVPQKSIMARLDWLHAVLDAPSSQNIPVRMLHLSFRDFLVDPANRSSTPLCIDEMQSHSAIAQNCIRIMKVNLRRDLCNMRAPGAPRTAIPQQTIETSLPPEVQYACQYWVHYWKESKVLFIGKCEHGRWSHKLTYGRFPQPFNGLR